MNRIKTANEKKNKKPIKKRLGMGLSSLLSKDEELSQVIKDKIQNKYNFDKKVGGTNTNKSTVTNKDSINQINFKPKDSSTESMLPIQNLVSGKFQPRKNFDLGELEELADSIRSNGILQPILVRPLTNKGTSYEIIAGERRWRASQLAKLHEVPVIIREFDDETALGVAMIENLQRSDLNIIEEADGYRTLMNTFQYTQEKLSEQLGKSRSHIANVLRLLSLPKFVKRHIINGDISFGHARTLIPLTEEQAKEVANKIIDDDLNVRQTEREVNKFKKSSSSKPPTAQNSQHNNANIDYLERELTNLLGLKVIIAHKTNNSGNMSIHYKSLDQIQPVIDKLKWRPK